jgi:pyruvate dehydrogenase E1 component alpha subunit
MTTTIENRLNLYKLAKRIRLIEEKISLEYANGKMRCPVHLSIGQEIVSAINF